VDVNSSIPLSPCTSWSTAIANAQAEAGET